MAEISENSLHTLPEELLIEILLHVQDVKRVPNIKSIGRCKCVSKTWRSLLSSPQFAKPRLFGPEKIFLLSDDSDVPDVPESSPYVTTLGDHGVATKVELPFLEGKTFRTHVSMQGSCHGLVLLFFRQGLLLVNPTTMEAVEIPLYGGGYYYGYGLGYDSRTDDYKVVSIQEDNVDVYNVRTRTWRTIPNVSTNPLEDSLFFYYEHYPTRPFVNGRINFVSPAGVDEVEPLVLAAFNVATEELESVPYPKGVCNLKKDYYGILTVLGGDLAMAVDMGDSHHIWLMKEYGVQDSWTKFVVNSSPWSCKPLCFLDEDENELLSIVSHEFVAHNRRSGVGRDMVVDGVPRYIWTGISFRESLISPIYN